MKKQLFFLTFVFLLFSISSGISKNEKEEYEQLDNSIIIDRLSNSDIEIEIPSLIFTFKETSIKIKFKNPEHNKLSLNGNQLNFIINGNDVLLKFENGEAKIQHKFESSETFSIYCEDFKFYKKITAYPLWVIITPLILIIGAIVIKKIK